MMLLVIRIYIYRGVEQCLFTPVFCFAITGCLPPLMPTWAESIGVLCTFLHHPIRSFTFLTRTQMLSGAFMCAHTHTHKGGHLHSMRNHMDRFLSFSSAVFSLRYRSSLWWVNTRWKETRTRWDEMKFDNQEIEVNRILMKLNFNTIVW